MTLDQLESKMRARLSQFAGFNHTALFDFAEQGALFLDAKTRPAKLRRGREQAECTMVTTIDTLDSILDGRKNATFAYMKKEIKIQGSLGLALKLNSLLSDD